VRDLSENRTKWPTASKVVEVCRLAVRLGVAAGEDRLRGVSWVLSKMDAALAPSTVTAVVPVSDLSDLHQRLAAAKDALARGPAVDAAVLLPSELAGLRSPRALLEPYRMELAGGALLVSGETHRFPWLNLGISSEANREVPSAKVARGPTSSGSELSAPVNSRALADSIDEGAASQNFIDDKPEKRRLREFIARYSVRPLLNGGVRFVIPQGAGRIAIVEEIEKIVGGVPGWPGLLQEQVDEWRRSVKFIDPVHSPTVVSVDGGLSESGESVSVARGIRRWNTLDPDEVALAHLVLFVATGRDLFGGIAEWCREGELMLREKARRAPVAEAGSEIGEKHDAVNSPVKPAEVITDLTDASRNPAVPLGPQSQDPEQSRPVAASLPKAAVNDEGTPWKVWRAGGNAPRPLKQEARAEEVGERPNRSPNAHPMPVDPEKLSRLRDFVGRYKVSVLGDGKVSLEIPAGKSRIEVLVEAHEIALEVGFPGVFDYRLSRWMEDASFCAVVSEPTLIAVEGGVPGSTNMTSYEQAQRGWNDVDLSDLALATMANLLATGRDLLRGFDVRAQADALCFTKQALQLSGVGPYLPYGWVRASRRISSSEVGELDRDATTLSQPVSELASLQAIVPGTTQSFSDQQPLLSTEGEIDRVCFAQPQEQEKRDLITEFIRRYAIQTLGPGRVKVTIPEGESRFDLISRAQEICAKLGWLGASVPTLAGWEQEEVFRVPVSAPYDIAVEAAIDQSVLLTHAEQVALGYNDVPLEDLAVAHLAHLVAQGSDLFYGYCVRSRAGALIFRRIGGLQMAPRRDDKRYFATAASRLLPKEAEVRQKDGLERPVHWGFPARCKF
jgi:hypothetical protein